MVTVAVEFWNLKGILFRWNQSESSKRLELNFFSENNSLPLNHENGINIWIEIIQALLSFLVSNDRSICEWSDVRQRTEQNIQIVYFIASTTDQKCSSELTWRRADRQMWRTINNFVISRREANHILLCVRWLEVTHKDEVHHHHHLWSEKPNLL